MNPEEGDLRPQFLDRFGMCVDVEGIPDPAERVKIMERQLLYEKDPHAFEHSWDDEEESLRETIVSAQKLLERDVR
jgi:Mg-chelatase subunit ChlI